VWCANTNGTVQRTQYYPSGLPWAEGEGQEVQNKKYNEKEFIEAHGLDEYYSQARMYYPAIMRTTTLDPLAEKYYSISPYAWCGNNPVRMVDPDGMEVFFYLMTYQNGRQTYNQVEFSNLPRDIKKLLYGFVTSKQGKQFLSNYIDGKQTFSLDDNNSITIKGNGMNFDLKYKFGDEVLINNKGSQTLGRSRWEVFEGKLTNSIWVFRPSNIENIAANFAHEHAVHSFNDVEYYKGNNKVELNAQQEHSNYDNKNSAEYKAMKMFLYMLKGWYGTKDMDKKLEKTFKEEYENNKRNVQIGN